MNLSRRELFSVLRWREPSAPFPANAVSAPKELVPFIVAAACLATRSFCSVCVERCPVPGAIRVSAGQPQIQPALCTGCGQCVAVCPAPVLAIRMSASTAEAL